MYKKLYGNEIFISGMPNIINIPVDIHKEAIKIINEKIENHLAVFLYFFLEHLFYNFKAINPKKIANNEIIFIKNKNQSMVAISDELYLKYNNKWFKNFNSSVVKIDKKDADDLKADIRYFDLQYGQLKAGAFTADHIVVTNYQTSESKNPDIYTKKYTELSGEDILKISSEFIENNPAFAFKTKMIK